MAFTDRSLWGVWRLGVVSAAVGATGTVWGQPGQAAPAGAAPELLDWKTLEAPLLSGHVQLTSREMFVKAGEAYFNPDWTWVIFQAVPVPEAGKEPDPFYSMYVAELARDDAGNVTGLKEPILVSPSGSANTCGWFHPANDGRVIFGSTLVRPERDEKPGFKVGTNKYAWSFPEETEVVSRTVAPMWTEAGIQAREQLAQLKQHLAKTESRMAERAAAGKEESIELRAVKADLVAQTELAEQALRVLEASGPTTGADAEQAVPLFARADYDAECSYSPDGRFVLYSHVDKRNPDGSADADIWVFDTRTGEHRPIVQAEGYDGGPFFSPDGECITFRSDRKGDNLLQLFVGKLKRDSGGVPVGLEWERALTDNQNVNWCPYWHPSGRFLVFATSEVGHQNYEVFAAEVSGAFIAGTETASGVKRTRITSASGADVLPVFSGDGRWMMWTAQRGPLVEGESKPSSQIWVAKVGAGMSPEALFGSAPQPAFP